MPSNSDNERRAGDVPWRARGVGLAPTFRCWSCDQPRSTSGSVARGPLKLRSCAQCVAKKAAA